MTLLEYIERHNLKQADFAARIGVSDASLSRMIHGTQRPSLTTLQAIERETSQAVLPSDFPSSIAPSEAAE